MYVLTFGMVFFFLVVAASQVLMARAQRALTDQEKLSLLNTNSSNHLPWFIVGLAVFFGLWVLAFLQMRLNQWMLPLFMAFVFAAGMGFSIFQLRRFKRANLGPSYIRLFTITSVMTQVAFLVLVGTMLYGNRTLLATPSSRWSDKTVSELFQTSPITPR